MYFLSCEEIKTIIIIIIITRHLLWGIVFQKEVKKIMGILFGRFCILYRYIASNSSLIWELWQTFLCFKSYIMQLAQKVNWYFVGVYIIIQTSIYTLSDLGDLGKLIGSLSRAIQH